MVGKQNTSGVHEFNVPGVPRFSGYCDLTTVPGTGWLVSKSAYLQLPNACRMCCPRQGVRILLFHNYRPAYCIIVTEDNFVGLMSAVMSAFYACRCFSVERTVP